LQSDIVREVVRELQIAPDPQAPARPLRSANAAAYLPYLKGRHLFNDRRNLDQAIRYFRESVAIDSAYAPAWAGLGMTWLVMPVYAGMPAVRARDSAEVALRKALTLDSLLAEAHAAVGSMRADQWRWAEAEPEFKRALQLDATDPTTHALYGEMLINLGRFDEALSRLNAANELDPLTSVIPSNIGWAYHSVGRHEEAIAAFRTALDFDPGFGYAHLGMGSSDQCSGPSWAVRPRTQTVNVQIRLLDRWYCPAVRA
jgi:tetratricopeptide (TPR) repeat protein